MKIRPFSSIYTTVLIGIILLLAALSAVFTAFFLSEGMSAQEDDLQKRGMFFTGQTAVLGELGVFSRNRDLLASLADKILADEDVIEVSFYGADKKLIAGTRRHGAPDDILPESTIASPSTLVRDNHKDKNIDHYVFVAPVTTEQFASDLGLFSEAPQTRQITAIGWTRIEMSGETIVRKNMALIRRSVAIAMVLMLVVSLLTALFLKRKVRRPLQQLVVAAQEIGRGNLDMKIEAPISNEIGILAEEFNRMAGALKERESELLRLAKAVEGAGEGIIIADPQKRVVYANPAFETMNQLRRDEVVGNDLTSYLGSDTSSENYKQLLAALEEGQSLSMETEVLRRDGSSFLAEISVSPIFNDKGKRVYTLLVKRDITEKDRLEKSLMQSQKMEAVGTLAGGIAHDFNNLLNGIIGYTTLARDVLKTDSNKAGKHLDTIDGLSRRAAGLTQQLLGFARRGKYRAEPISTNDLVMELTALLSETLDRRIAIVKHLSPNIPLVKADSNQMHQVLLNLSLNARDAMPDGGTLTFRTDVVLVDQKTALKYKYEVEPGWYVQIAISDTGHGMDKDTVARIFEPFFTTKEPGKGTGLGLAMVYGIIKNHGGFISVYSEPGLGTTFKIYLPRAEETANIPLIRKEEKHMANETILIVDDEEFIREMLVEMLSPAGYKVLAAENGENCIELIESGKASVDLVLLDLIMPGMGGKETFDSLMKLQRNIKVLVSSGYGDEEDVREILQNGARGFVQKPYFREQLVESIRKALET